MRPDTPDVKLETLLTEQRWLSRLAQRLVRDGSSADDLVQETTVRALESGGDQAVTRGWLARVASRERAHSARRDRERRAREVRAARHEATGSTLDVLEQISTQRELSRLVLELPEDQREVIALRFWNDLPPRKIAQRLGLGVETVKSRQKRALLALRERLDAENGGDRARWLTALAPLADGARGPLGAGLERVTQRASDLLGHSLETVPPLLGTALVSTAILKFALPIVLIAGVVIVTVRDPAIGPTVETEAATRVVSRAETADLAHVEGRTNTRVAAPLAVRPPAPTPNGSSAILATAPVVDAATFAPLLGRLVDLEGAPLAGVAVYDMAGGSAGPPVTTDASGHFDLAGGAGVRGGVVPGSWTTVFAAQPSPATVTERSIAVAAPSIVLAGHVINPWGAPVEGARVDVTLPAIRVRGLPFDLDHSLAQEWVTITDAEGVFRLDGAPGTSGAVLRVRADELPIHTAAAPAVDAENIWVVLAGPEDGDGQLTGLVVDDAGIPVPDATVSFGVETTGTGDDGRFVLPLEDSSGMNTRAKRFLGDPIVPTEIVAFAAGHRMGHFDAPRDADGAPRWPESIVIQLGGEPLSISGTVVDADGVPIDDAGVWIVDSTLLGIGARGTVILEGEQGGTEDGWPWTQTNSDGEFTLSGLEDRPYQIVALDDASLLRTAPATIQAGATDTILRLPELARWELLRGKIVDRDGKPVSDVQISVTTDTVQIRVAGQVVGTQHARRADTLLTSSTGAFEFALVPRRSVYLRLDGPGIVPLEWGRDAFALEELLDDPGRVEITVGLRRRFRVELADPLRADAVAVLDENGERLGLSLMLGNGRRDGPQLPIAGGSTGVLTVSDAAATMVLSLDGAEVQRLPIQFEDDEVRVFEL